LPSEPGTFRILAVSGSLRAASSNGTIVRVAQRVAPDGIHVDLYHGLASLPHFNPDLDRELDDPRLPEVVRALRREVATVDALVISSPEYAHGVPGSLKNFLDWLVGGAEMVDKHVALWSTAPHAIHAQASLAETLRTMTAVLVTEAGLAISLDGRTDDAEVAADAQVAAPIVQALNALRRMAAAR
jgi:NAD(P)H-dependent FMN reductase